MNNLEHLSYREVRSPGDISYDSFRKTLSPRYSIVWRDIFFGYFFLGGFLFLSTRVHYDNIIALVFCIFFGSLITGFVLAYLSLFLHEAGHFNLHPNKKKNDLLATILIGVLFGVSLGAYRKIHWQHHLHLASSADPESSYFHELTAGFLLESVTGIYLLKVVLSKSNHSLLSHKMKVNSLKMLAAGTILSFSIIAVCVLLHAWATAIIWLAGLLIFFPFFAALRQILEHRDELAKKGFYQDCVQNKVARLFTSDLFSRIFGAAGFNKHMIHHWDPQISYTRLRDIEHFLSQCNQTKEILFSSKTTYFKTFRKLLR